MGHDLDLRGLGLEVGVEDFSLILVVTATVQM
jgi:hypothetical protein